jgi:HTH-type transcriptional regulator / antitoxin MqsA
MTSKWNGERCPICAKGTLHDGSQEIAQQYKGHTLTTVSRGAFCDTCNDGIVEFDEAEENEWIRFRDEVDAKQGAELARIRKKLRLTQLQAGRIAGGGKNAFSRYEKGTAKPVNAVVNLFKILDNHPELLSEMNVTGE